MNSITVNEIIDAFATFNGSVKIADIKKYIFEQRDNSFAPYESKYSFDQTIQAIINRHCAESPQFNGQENFVKEYTGYYKLKDFRQSPTDKLLFQYKILNVEDGENITRSIRAVNQINRNTKLVNALKLLYENKCQICNIKIAIGENEYYSEVHHLKPLGMPHNGPDKIENMIIVCPNCHVKLDYKSLRLEINQITVTEPHIIGEEFIIYQNSKNN